MPQSLQVLLRRFCKADPYHFYQAGEYRVQPLYTTIGRVLPEKSHTGSAASRTAKAGETAQQSAHSYTGLPATGFFRQRQHRRSQFSEAVTS